jgi:hypothetical protein
MPSPVLSDQLRAVFAMLLWFPSVVSFILTNPLDQILALEDRCVLPVLFAPNLHILMG